MIFVRSILLYEQNTFLKPRIFNIFKCKIPIKPQPKTGILFSFLGDILFIDERTQAKISVYILSEGFILSPLYIIEFLLLTPEITTYLESAQGLKLTSVCGFIIIEFSIV
ncbi:hypothetical protein ABB41_04715 [Lactococcus lactis]|nr:hypothetical protein ABB41_04715 [Lactococcus lactis]